MARALRDETILVVDDDDAVRDEIIQALAVQGFAAIGASDGKIALQILENGPIDLVVSDILMPNMDGIELLRACGKAKPNLKIIALSSGGSVGYDLISLTSQGFGAFAMLAKPVDLGALLQTVGSALNEH